MQVAKRIHRIQVPMGERYVCVYLLAGEERLLVVDSGLADTPATFIGPYIEQENLTSQAPPFVVVTHADNDHFGGNGPLQELLGNSILLCHTLDRALIEDVERLINERYDEWAGGHHMPLDEGVKAWVRETTTARPVDVVLQGGEQLRLGPDWYVDVLHTPGHSRGHLTLYDAQSRTAVIEDAALWNSVPDKEGKAALPPTYRYVDSYEATLKQLLQLPISLLLTGHYPVYRDQEVAEFLLGSLAFVHGVDGALARTLQAASSGRTLQQLIAELSPRLGSWPESAAIFLAHPLTGHLERMTQYGKVEQSVQSGQITYEWLR